MFKERQKLRKTCKELFLETLQLRLRNNFWEKLYWEMILQLFSASCVRNPEAAIRGVLKKRLLLKNSQYSQENTCVGVFLILPHRCFSVNIVKFSRTPNLKKHLRTTASVNSRTVLFQESIALSFKQSALTSGICNLGELV